MGWKLVRDGNREFAEAHGLQGTWRVSPDPQRALLKNLFEEAGEFAEHMHPSELYDLGDVVAELICLEDPHGEWKARHDRKVALFGLFSGHMEWNPFPDPAVIHPVTGNWETTRDDPA